MENDPNSDHQNPEKLMSDHKISSKDRDRDDDDDDDDDQEHQAATISSSARSYECSFCKRGFTNAQALGGHMNIHRKDKAKLKLLANNLSAREYQTKQQQSSTIIPNLPVVMSEGLSDDHHGNIVTTTTTSWFLNQEPTSDHDHHERGLSSSDQDRRSSSADSGLDLELRLGLEPPQDSSSTAAVATRKFF